MQEHLPDHNASAQQHDAVELAEKIRQKYPAGQWEFAYRSDGVTVELHSDGETFSKTWHVLLQNVQTGEHIVWRWLGPGHYSGMRLPKKIKHIRTGQSAAKIRDAFPAKFSEQEKKKFLATITGGISAAILLTVASLFITKQAIDNRQRPADPVRAPAPSRVFKVEPTIQKPENKLDHSFDRFRHNFLRFFQKKPQQ